MPTPNLDAQVARSVDAPPALAPHMADLFRGMPSLGSQPGVVVRLLRQSGLRRGGRIAELGCGKGTLAVRLASEFAARIIAVDGCDAFIEEARTLARRRAPHARCDFRIGDIHAGNLVRSLGGRRFDAALMLGLDGVEHAAPLLRRLVNDGGLYVIDDAVRDQRRAGLPELWGTPTAAELQSAIHALGDRVVATHRPTPAAVGAMNLRLYRRLARNADLLRKTRPRLRSAIAEFLRRQRDANRVLAGSLRPMIWVVRRGG